MFARTFTALGLALFVAVGTARQAEAQLTFFGEDTDGSESTRSTNVFSLAAENLFLANLVGVGTETFDSFLTGIGVPLALIFPGAGTATLTGGGTVQTLACAPGPDPNCTNTNGVGRYPVSSPNFWEVNATNFVITFSNPVAAFGFYGNDIGDFGGNLSLSFLTGGGVIAVPVPHTVVPSGQFGGVNGGNLFYFGYINVANPFTQVTFAMNISGDFFGFDNMTVGSVQQVSVVPEPSSWMLLATGFLGLGFVARRKKGPGRGGGRA